MRSNIASLTAVLATIAAGCGGGGGGSGSASPGLSINAVAATSTAAGEYAITWTTSRPATSSVEHGPTSSYGTQSPFDGSLVSNHEVHLTGLDPGTVHHYRVLSTDALTTAGPIAGPLTHPSRSCN